MREKIFNMGSDMIQKQYYVNELHPDNQESIKQGETLEPCIRGAKKIAEDPKLKKLVKEILTHSQ